MTSIKINGVTYRPRWAWSPAYLAWVKARDTRAGATVVYAGEDGLHTCAVSPLTGNPVKLPTLTRRELAFLETLKAELAS